MSEAYVGEIRMMAFNFPPKNWALCNGQILQISQNAALFSILGTTYGGNGTTTFALPNLQGRAPVHFGNGNGLPPVALGQAGGEEAHALTGPETAAHTHQVMGATNPPTGNAIGPGNNYLGSSTSLLYTTGALAGDLAPETVKPVAGGQPHANLQPYQVVSFCICLFGLFPSRN